VTAKLELQHGQQHVSAITSPSEQDEVFSELTTGYTASQRISFHHSSISRWADATGIISSSLERLLLLMVAMPDDELDQVR
jgi:hypothetical protein